MAGRNRIPKLRPYSVKITLFGVYLLCFVCELLIIVLWETDYGVKSPVNQSYPVLILKDLFWHAWPWLCWQYKHQKLVIMSIGFYPSNQHDVKWGRQRPNSFSCRFSRWRSWASSSGFYPSSAEIQEPRSILLAEGGEMRFFWPFLRTGFCCE